MTLDAQKKTIMLIEDDASLRGLLKRFFTRRQFKVVDTGDFNIAVLMAQKHMPEYVLLDIMLGDYSGIDLIQPLKHALPRCEIVILTGHAEVELAVNALKMGAKDFLIKPADGNFILAKFSEASLPIVSLTAPVPEPLKDLEREHLRTILAKYRGNVTHTAEALRIPRRTLQRKLSRFGISNLSSVR